MSRTKNYAKTFSNEIGLSSYIFIFSIATIYTIFSIYAVNYQFFLTIIATNYSFIDKVEVINSLLIGSWAMFQKTEIAIILITSLLIGLNLALILKTLKKIKNSGKIALTAGSGGVLAIIGGGCASCGLTLLSLLGVSSKFLPFNGLFMQAISIVLLIASAFYMLRQLQSTKYCKTK